jgi:branched-chain amino acid transport system substrate-binding protein
VDAAALQSTERRVVRSKRVSVKWLVPVVAISLVAAACSSSKSTTKTGDTGSSGTAATTTVAAVSPADNGGRKTGNSAGFTLGTLLPLTGDLSQLGPPMVKAGEMAVRDINAAGGVNGKQITVVAKDDGGGSQNDLAKANVGQLINQSKVDMILGAASSATTKEVIGDIVSSGTVECSPSNTGADLTQYPDKGLYFRTAPPDELQGPALAKAITNDGHSKVAVIALNNDYGQGFVPFLQQGLSSAGAKIVTTVPIDPKGSSFDADVDKALRSNPDSIVIVAYPDTGGAVLKSLAQKGKGPKVLPTYVTDGLQSNDLYKNVDPNNPASVAGIKGTAASAAPEGGTPDFASQLKAFAPEVTSPIYSAQSYDCVTIAALAAEKAKSNAPYDIAKNFAAVTSKNGEKCTSFKQCKDLLAQGKTINYVGAAGQLNLNKYGEPSKGDYELYEFQADGTYKTLQHVAVG